MSSSWMSHRAGKLVSSLHTARPRVSPLADFDTWDPEYTLAEFFLWKNFGSRSILALVIYTAIWYLRGSIYSMWQWGKMTRTEKNMNMSSHGHYFQVWKWKVLMFSREHASFHYLLTNIRVDGTSSLLEGWTRNTSAPSAFSARGNHTRLVVATGRLNFAPSKLQRISTLICLFSDFVTRAS